MRFCRDERGATAIESGFILALIFLVIIAGFTALGAGGHGLFSRIGAAVAAI